VTNKLIIDSRKDYIRNRLADATGNSRQRWKIANELLHRNDKSTQSTPDTDLTPERCNLFCQYFVTKLSAIASKIDEQLKSLCLPHLSTQVFHKPPVFIGFKRVSVFDVQRIIAKMPAKTSPLDHIPITLVKSCSDIFGDLLSKLANLSFTEGKFPDQFKLCQVTPILKKHGLAADDPSNYRPIINLSTFSEVLKKPSQSQLRNHVNASPNNASLQSAYNAFHSTETAMTKVVSDLLTNVDSGSPSLLLSLDISAAFDTLNHKRLLQRAQDLFGFDGQTNLWLASYLSDRSSFVSMGASKSNTITHSTGVPQGSVLGPLLFSISTTPIGSLISSLGILYHQYADDTQLFKNGQQS
jgi:Reverse transcriptase (RNA-dependent DNA polymerase)